MSVGLVIVSHSGRIAEGVVELAAQMAEGVALVAAGGTDDGGIGTSFDRVSAALAEAESGDGVVVLCDLGSAILTAETALDFLDDEARARVRIADAPLVEGAVAAAVAARTGADLEGVVAAARTANGSEAGEGIGSGSSAARSEAATAVASTSASTATSTSVLSRRTTLVNESGLHARPASEFVKAASAFDAAVTVQGVDAKSLLRIMGLGLGQGTEIEITAAGPEAAAALDALVDLVDSGFGEA